MLAFEEQLQRLNDMRPELEELGKALHIEGMREELAALSEKAQDPNFWEDMAASQVILQKQKQLAAKVDSYQSLVTQFDDAITLIEIAEETGDESVLGEVVDSVNRIESTIRTQKLATLLTGEYDSKSAILSFHAGAGGTEAQDWVQMLYRMYTHWAESHGYKYKILDYLDGDEAGIKSASILIEGLNVYGYLRSEAGVHRLVRISPFDSSGRRHTSFASVEVMPEIEEDTGIAIRD
jgi:peptide chain release factor 2